MSTSLAGQTVDAARRLLTARFRALQIETPELDARLLAGAALDLDLTGLVSSAHRALDAGEAARLAQFADRREAGEPVARIVGKKEFWGLPLSLSAETLVPRPDTETIVEAVLEALATQGGRSRPLVIADLGTGSGAILLALLTELPAARGIATDISLGALSTARRNAAELGLGARASFVACDYAAALAGGLNLIVSNPPYIPSGDIIGLAPEVRLHDPWRALDGGTDGLDAYRVIVPAAARLLAPGGLLVVEVGFDQSDAVTALMASAGLARPLPVRQDLAGIRRAVIGQKPR